MLPSRMAKDISSSSSSSSKSDHLPRQCKQKAERQLSTEKGRTKSSRRDSSDKIVLSSSSDIATELPSYSARGRKGLSGDRATILPASSQPT